MRRLKNYLLATAGIAMLLLVIPLLSIDSKASEHDKYMTALKNLVALSQAAPDEATRGVEKQRELVQSLTRQSSAIGGAIGGYANDGDEAKARETKQLMLRALAREKVVLQQLEANARQNAQVHRSVMLLAAELKKLNCQAGQK